MGVLVYGVYSGFFLCGSSYGSSNGSIIWVFPMGILVRLGLRYRLLWFGSLGGLGGWAWLENGNGIC